MFNNLIESNVHTAALKRRSSFLIGTMLAYALLLLAAGVGSIYAYEAHVDNQSLELTSLVTMVPIAATPPKREPIRTAASQPRPTASTNTAAQSPMRTMNMASVTDMRKPPVGIHTTGNNVPPMVGNAVIGNRNYDIGGSSNLPFGDGNGPGGTSAGSNGSGNELAVAPPPEMPKVESKPHKQKLVQSLGVIESKVTYKAVPAYPELAKKVHASGVVPVQILLDEQGRVVSARSTGGHPLLRGAAEKAAYQTKFSPTLLSGQPVKVSGVITFNFILR